MVILGLTNGIKMKRRSFLGTLFGIPALYWATKLGPMEGPVEEITHVPMAVGDEAMAGVGDGDYAFIFETNPRVNWPKPDVDWEKLEQELGQYD